jgi:flagellar basal-body rod protein FlgG
MLEGLRTAAAGMAAMQQKLDGIANDLANANTTGYKHADRLRDLLYEQGGRPSANRRACAAPVRGRRRRARRLRARARWPPASARRRIEGEASSRSVSPTAAGLTRDGGCTATPTAA